MIRTRDPHFFGLIGGHAFGLLLLTGARRSEIAKLSRDRILSDRLVLPPTHTKMGEKH